MDRSASLQQQSQRLAQKSDMNLINAAMKGDAGCIPHLIEALTALGYILPAGSVRGAEPTHAKVHDVDYLLWIMRLIRLDTISVAATKGLLKKQHRKIAMPLMDLWGVFQR